MEQELSGNAYRKSYLPGRGSPALGEAISKKINDRCGLSSTQEDVLVPPGSKEGIYCMQTAYYNYGELLLSPAWVSHDTQARIIDHQTRWIQTNREDGFKIMPDKLEDELSCDIHRPRISILNSPGTPTGVSYTKRELKHLATMAKKHRLIVLSDYSSKECKMIFQNIILKMLGSMEYYTFCIVTILNRLIVRNNVKSCYV